MPEPRHHPGLPVRCGQHLVRFLVRLWMRLYFRWRVVNPPRLSGGFVVAANHSSFLDPLVLGAASPRPVGFFINSVSYRSIRLGWFFRLFESIPIDVLGRNREPMREARRRLAGGAVVGVFPEGGISRDGGLLLGNPGAVALLSDEVQVVPVGLRGVADAMPHGSGFPRPRRIEVCFGDPIPAAELLVGAGRKEQLHHATERLMAEIGRLCGKPSREEQLRAQKS